MYKLLINLWLGDGRPTAGTIIKLDSPGPSNLTIYGRPTAGTIIKLDSWVWAGPLFLGFGCLVHS